MIRLCVIYRSTQTGKKYQETKITKFMDEFNEYLDSVVNKVGSPIICGDFNFHVEDTQNKAANDFISLCSSKGFIQHVKSKTHISGGTLDLVFTLANVSDSLPIQSVNVEPNTGTLSDHYLLSFQLPLSLGTLKTNDYEEKQIRELGKINIGSFREDLFFSDLNQSEFKSLDHAVELYHTVLQDILDKHAPVISKKFNVRKSEFWNEKCQNAARKRRRAKRGFHKARENVKDHPDQNDLLVKLEEKRTEFYESSIDSGIVINMARNEFFCKQLSSCKGDSRGTYKIVNKLLDIV